MSKRQVFFTVALALALSVLGMSAVVMAQGEAPAAPLLQLEHNPEIRDLRVLSCDNTPTNELPQELEVVRYQGPDIGVLTTTLQLVWSEDAGCQSTQSFGGSFGVRRIKLPQAAWTLGFFGPFSDYYWDIVPGMSWERTVESATINIHHDVQNHQVRIHACGMPEEGLPTSFNYVQWGTPHTSSFEWNYENDWCYVHLSIGGSDDLGIEEVSIPDWSGMFGYHDVLSRNLWRQSDTAWSQAPIVVTLTDAVCKLVDPETDLQVGNCQEVTLVVSTTVPSEFWGQFTVGGGPVSSTHGTTVTLGLNGSSAVGMTEGHLLNPVTWGCTLEPCPASVSSSGLAMRLVPAGYDFDFISYEEGIYTYLWDFYPEWAKRSVQMTGTVVWDEALLCPDLQLAEWGEVFYSPLIETGPVEQSAVLTVQPGNWDTPLPDLVGPRDCVATRQYIPFLVR